MQSLRLATFAATLTLSLTACGPESHAAPADATWIVGRYLVCYGEFEDCYGSYLYEVEFYEDGTLISTQVECGYPKAPGLDRQALWAGTSDDGIVDLTPAAGQTGVLLTGGGVSEATARQTDDCLRVDVEGLTRRPGFPDLIDDYVLFRGRFVYDSEDGQLCQSTKPEYAQGGPPECPDEDP